ncbi:phosphatidylglycerol/phosphatidylinositol transfer protein [Trichodelitschia bisporula]|uniref:Phosphatidylglycerol/phosphatidylinositol transfer protein n=1 Tax=Trichodelitschia bisporula TaxID=703511 RepID=A0A6G1I5Y5_9PEZI|nr:phosphatidylglycerol/phosphatidylinositol transfer protein [Trichodelitschia bisporula]
MKLLTPVLPLLCVTAVAARSVWLGGSSNEQVALGDELKVPGVNPLFYCSDASNDLLVIDHVDLSPNPPEAGQSLTIAAKGTLLEDIEEGAKVHIQVKFGLITLINQDTDLCDQVKNVDLECPLEKGETVLTKTVELPSRIPPGRYRVLADVYTKDRVKITCLTAEVVFHPHL